METTIEAFGVTRLVKVDDRFFLRDSTGVGRSLKYQGVDVVDGQFGAWKPIGAEQTADGYKVVFKKGADQYTVWTLDSKGDQVSASPTVSGSSPTVQALEPLFQQDLNGDGKTVIEASGATRLVKVGNQYSLLDGSGAGPSLKYQGVAIVDGQFGAWEPIGAEQTASGYQVVFKKGVDQYTVWILDSDGNQLSASATVSGASTALQSLEPVFQQDLNGDGVTGTVIEVGGSTRVVKTGNQFFLLDGTGAGPSLKYQGIAIVEGQFGAWKPIGAEQTASGYQVVFKKGADQYTVWALDGSGNQVSTSATLSGASPTIQALEPVLHQDLNGDGTVAPAGTVIEAFGSTDLIEAGNQFFLLDGTGTGPSLKVGGVPIVGGGAWTPIGAERTASGYQVVYKKGTDGYRVSTLDGNGNQVSIGAAVSGSSSSVRELEPAFHQDLNGDGVVGSPLSLGNPRASVTATSITFVATSLTGASLSLAGPFDAAFGHPAITSGAVTTLIPGVQAVAVGGTLRVTDGASVVDALGLYLGTGGNDTAVAPNAVLPNALFGFGGDDRLTGGSGADTIVGGDGNDTIVGALNDALIDGGAGFDTLALAGADLTLDLTDQVQAAKLVGIEAIDLTGAGDNMLKLNRQAVLDEVGADGSGVHVLKVEGNAGDTVWFDDIWSKAGTVTEGAVTYDRYVDSAGDAEVRVEQGVTVSMPTRFDLATLDPSQGFIIQGDGAADRLGHSVSSAGDVNGDGFADVIVGAPLGDDGGNGAGEAYVVFGQESGFGTVDGTGRSVIDLTSLSTTNGFIIQGDVARDSTGWSVSSAGDVNGDGFADLIVGAHAAGRGDDLYAGAAYVVFGKASGFGTVNGTGRAVIDLSNVGSSFTPAEGFIIKGDTDGDQAGFSVSSAGDVNGDGFADLIVGARYAANGAGEAYVVFGKASGFGTVDGTGRSVVDVSNVGSSFTPAKGFVIRGDAGDDQAGSSVSSAGDVNGDGFADLIVGAPSGNDGGNKAGEAYVVFGKASGFGTTDGTGRAVIDLTVLAPSAGFVIQGDKALDYAGYSVSAAGDVNGDGFADLIVGAHRNGLYSDGRPPGEAYVVFGKASGFGAVNGTGRSVVDVAILAPSAGFVIQGAEAADSTGFSVSSAGDVNGDGFADLIVGAPYGGGDDAGGGPGQAYVVFGKASGFGTVDGSGRSVLDLNDLSPSAGFVIQADGAYDRVGWSVSSAGDVNRDGFDDLIVGAPQGSDGGEGAGEAYVLFGGAFGGSTAPVVLAGTAAAEMLIGGAGNDMLSGGGGADSIRGGAGDDRLTVGDLAFRSVDGGSGSDTLVLTGSGQNFDFTALANTKVIGIETIDITGSGNNSLTLGFADVAAMTDGDSSIFSAADSHHALVVQGNAGDSVTLQNYDPDGAGGVAAATWTLVQAAAGLDGSSGGAYDIYNLVRGGSVLASVATDSDMLIQISTVT